MSFNELIINPDNHLEYKLVTKDSLWSYLTFSYEIRAYNYHKGKYAT
jgi:hypothetical protein